MQNFRVFIMLTILFIFFTTASLAAELQVAVSIPPQKWLVEQIGGNLVSIDTLVDAGQKPHTFIPTPRQITRLFNADIHFLIGLAFEQQIYRKVSKADNHPKMIDTTRSIKRIPMQHDHKHDHDKRKPHACGPHHSDGLDPHVWLNLTNLRIMAEIIAEALSEADPKHSNIYADNLKKLIVMLERSDEQIGEMLLPFKGKSFFVFHPAFGYFAYAYDLKQKAVEVEGKSPTPRQLEALIKNIKDAQIDVIFVQPGFDQRSAQIIANAIDGSLVTIDPLAENVVATLHALAEAIKNKKI